MPKFKKSCNNSSHEEWTKNEGGAIVNLTERGLLSLVEVFECFIEAELGKKAPRGVNSSALRVFDNDLKNEN